MWLAKAVRLVDQEQENREWKKFWIWYTIYGGLNKPIVENTPSKGLSSMSDLNAKKGNGDSSIELKVGYNVEHNLFW